MKTLKIYLSILSLLTFSISNAEITKGITDVRFKPGGEIAFILFDNVNIKCGAIEGKWQSMDIYLPSKRAYFDGKIKITKGDSLFDATGKKIGYIVSDQIDAMPMGNKELNSYTMRLAGYIVAGSSRTSSILENRLSGIIISNKKNLTYTVFKKFIADFELTEYSDETDKLLYPNNISYVVWYDSYISGPTVFRVQLIFNHEKLIAVFHGNKLKKTGFPEIKTKDSNNLLWVKNRNLTEMKKFADTYNRLRESDDDADDEK